MPPRLAPAPRRKVSTLARAACSDEFDLAQRPPLPSGHPVSWRLLTNGTVLEGAEYPFPVFSDWYVIGIKSWWINDPEPRSKASLRRNVQ